MTSDLGFTFGAFAQGVESRQEFWDLAMKGGVHVLDPEYTDYPDMPSLRAAAYREATNRGLKLSTVLVDQGRLLMASYGGPENQPQVTRAQFKVLAGHLKGQRGDLTLTMGDQFPQRAETPQGVEFHLPEIDPEGPLFIDPGNFWEGRQWGPALTWHCPFGPDRPNPQQCTWFPHTEFWELGELTWLQERRESGTLFPWELRQGKVPPGTELSDSSGWVWKPEEWLELASERRYCDCPMRLSGVLINPDNRRDHPDGCAYWKVPAAINDLDNVARFQDPRGLKVPALMDDAEIRMKLLEARDPDRERKIFERTVRQKRQRAREAEQQRQRMEHSERLGEVNRGTVNPDHIWG